MEKFKFLVTVYIGDTNLEGNVYWTHYFEWLGKAREAFAKWAIPDILAIIGTGLTLITVETSLRHLKSAYLYDDISVEVGVKEVRKASLQLSFDFFNQTKGELIATGWQTIAFGQNGRLISVPERIRDKAREFALETKKPVLVE